MPTSSGWTDDRVQTLIRLWNAGLSASQIARALAGGLSRNAVIGKAHRLGLSPRGKPSLPDAGVHQRIKARRRAQPSFGTYAAPAADPPGPRGSATVLSVRLGQCRWPIGDPRAGDFSLCGGPVARGAYCAGHAELAYRSIANQPPRDHLLKLAGLA